MRHQQPESKALEIPMTSMEIQLPSNDAADLQDKASAVGMPAARFLGVCTLLGLMGRCTHKCKPS